MNLIVLFFFLLLINIVVRSNRLGMETVASPTTPRNSKHAPAGSGGGLGRRATILSPLSKLGKRTPTANYSNASGTPTKAGGVASPSAGLRKGAVAAAVADAENSVGVAPAAPSMRSLDDMHAASSPSLPATGTKRKERPVTMQFANNDAAMSWTRHAKKKELVVEVERLTSLVHEYQARISTFEREVVLSQENAELLKKRLRRAESRVETLEKSMDKELWRSYAAMHSRGY